MIHCIFIKNENHNEINGNLIKRCILWVDQISKKNYLLE